MRRRRLATPLQRLSPLLRAAEIGSDDAALQLPDAESQPRVRRRMHLHSLGWRPACVHGLVWQHDVALSRHKTASADMQHASPRS